VHYKRKKSEKKMNLSQQIPKVLIIGLLLGGVSVVANNMLSGSSDTSIIDVKMPQQLSKASQQGHKIFSENCAACHGENGAGSDKGPPLIHNIYNPGHHGDMSFYNAVTNGVQRHHWNFGNMPPQPQVTREDTGEIIKFIRDVQIENNIRYQAHKM
jgi:cytochrome c